MPLTRFRSLAVVRLLFALCLCCGLAGTGQAQVVDARPPLDPQAAAWLATRPVVRLAPDPDFAPIDFFDAQGRHRGLSADLVDLLTERSGLQVQRVRRADFEAVLADLRAGRIDFASSVFRSTERERRMLFSNAYLRLPAALYGPAGQPPLSSLAELRGRRLAVTTGHVWQELLVAAGFAAELRPAPNTRAALEAVVAGQADAYIGDLLTTAPVLRAARLQDRLVVLGESGLEAELAFAVRPGLPQLQRVLDHALAGVSVEQEAALRARWEGPEAADAATGTDAEDPLAQVPPGRTSELAALRVEVEALPAAEQAPLLKQLDDAARLEEEAEQALQRAVAIRAEAAQRSQEPAIDAPAETAPSAAEELLRWRGSLPQRATLAQLEQLLATEQAARGSLQETLARLASEAAELQQRPTQLRQQLSALGARIDALVLPEDGADLAVRVAREPKLAELRELRARNAELLLQRSHLDLQQTALLERQAERQRALEQRNARIEVLAQLIAERNDSEMAAELAQLRAAVQRHQQAAPVLREVATDNFDTGTALARETSRLAQLREAAQRIETQLAEVAAALKNSQARIAIGGITEAVGMLLLAERRKLPQVAALRAELAALRRAAADVQLSQIALTEERDGLLNLGGAISRRLSADGDGEVVLQPEQRAELTDLLLVRSQLLPRLLQVQQRVLEVIDSTDEQLTRLLAASEALGRLMAQNLLWIPNDRMVGSGWLQQLGAGWAELFKPARWREAQTRMARQLRLRPWWAVVLLVPLALWLLRPRFDRALQALATKLRNVREDRYTYTLLALPLTALRAAPMALLTLVGGLACQQLGAGHRFSQNLGSALLLTAPVLWLLALLATMNRENGLTHAHLRWPKQRREALLRLRPLLYFAVVPLYFVVQLAAARDLDLGNGTVLRSSLVLLHGTLAACLAWLLAPDRLFAARGGGIGHYPTLRRFLRIGLTAGFVLLAVLPLLGYVFTSATLLKVAMHTFAVLFGVALAHGLVVRWLVLGERRIAMAQQQQRADAPDRPAADPALEAPNVPIESIDLRAVSVQSRTLLRAFTVVALVSGLLWALAEVAPAFSLLDRIVLWQSDQVVDGATLPRSITLGNVVLALATLLVGISAARNIPGLLEIVLLKRFTSDASVRYAVVAITRYVITFVAMVLLLGFLGVRWGHLQWLAAAFSVGLGFGLQEIFGNFAAGLILLFERPFRVGDTVTIGDLSGTVRRIQTRATTIVDADNKEIVVPNKTFITERFVNWTLTDTTTRIVVRVVVAYDADPRQVREELLALADSHPAVLQDPAPAALFMLLGDHGLNFELRCFVSEIADRLQTLHELHTAVLERFRARGIEIPYPQLRVHLPPGEDQGKAAPAAVAEPIVLAKP